MSEAKLTPEQFEIMTGEDPADWPETFAPGTLAKVVTHGEGLWAKITSDDGTTITAALDNQPFDGFAELGDPVEFRRANVREIIAPS